MLWLVAALANSWLTAQGAELNHHYKQEGFRLNMWRTLLMACFWAPLAVISVWPDDPIFYMVAMFNALGIIVGNVVKADLSARHNGRVAILDMPLKALFVFFLWLIVDSGAREPLLKNPMLLVLILLFFGVMVFGMNMMRRNDASWEALRAIVPVVILGGLSDIFVRLTMTPDVLAERLVVYLFLITSFSAVSSVFFWRWRPRPTEPLYSRRMMEAAGFAAMNSLLGQACYVIGLAYAPNPAYASMVVLLAPVWIMLINKWKGIQDNANPVAGLVLLAGAVGLMLVTIQH